MCSSHWTTSDFHCSLLWSHVLPSDCIFPLHPTLNLWYRRWYLSSERRLAFPRRSRVLPYKRTGHGIGAYSSLCHILQINTCRWPHSTKSWLLPLFPSMWVIRYKTPESPNTFCFWLKSPLHFYALLLSLLVFQLPAFWLLQTTPSPAPPKIP